MGSLAVASLTVLANLIDGAVDFIVEFLMFTQWCIAADGKNMRTEVIVFVLYEQTTDCQFDLLRREQLLDCRCFNLHAMMHCCWYRNAYWSHVLYATYRSPRKPTTWVLFKHQTVQLHRFVCSHGFHSACLRACLLATREGDRQQFGMQPCYLEGLRSFQTSQVTNSWKDDFQSLGDF